MLAAFNELVEQRIREAMRRGDFERLPGEGRPLDLDDDAMVPEELRVAHRILKNAGYVPPAVQALRDVGQLLGPALAAENACGDDRRASRRLLALTMVLEQHGLHLTGQAALAYHRGIAEKLGGGR
jgi:hypothetical protein